MFIYLLSIAFFIFVLLKGVGEEGLKAKLLTLSATLVAGYNLYSIFFGTLSDSFVINLLLCIIPGIVFFIGLILVFDNETNNNGKNANTCNSTNNSSSFYKENIVDNETTQPNYKANNQTSENDDNNDKPINYKNAKIDGFGSCDVEETDEFIKITMRAEGKEYDFYVKGSNIVAYRFEKTKKPQSY